MEERRVSRPATGIALAEGDLLTPYGVGIEALWQGLLSERTAVRPVANRFDARPFTSALAGLVNLPDSDARESFSLRMVRLLADRLRGRIPADALPILATTVGEVDLMEREVLTPDATVSDVSMPTRLLAKAAPLFGLNRPGLVVSAACASSTAALAHGAALIRSGVESAVFVVACDSVTEFVFSGFSALMALDPEPARPFDRTRKGLNVGEAAACVLLLSASRARDERRACQGWLTGWGQSNDANHMTGPSRDGAGLARAVRASLDRAGRSPSAIRAICAHGTGTVYNDSMEMKAFRSVFSTAGSRPTFSVKGGIGHTMGAAGLVEALISLQALRTDIVPPTVGLSAPDAESAGWASGRSQPLADGEAILSTNSGFGGINTSLVLEAARTADGEAS
jgi:3-oxoacyl-[acyl-carrier-protein] synthase II